MFTSSDDEREIYRGIVRFARAMDERNWTEIEAITTKDATADLGTGPLASRAEMIALIRTFLDDCGPTQHLVANILIDIEGDTARSRAYVSDMHLGTDDLDGQFFRTLGDYHDQWAKTPNGWRMTHRTKHNHGSLGSLAVLGPGPANWEASSE
ncbi:MULTISPECIES: nuclear transport factor 2 family protein [unclassified Rhodococcus (in: high G+C Gram-positive bacteria)]|uniref:nuclear transport factor 2 family protein n=1 Tax=unclassified Rhodococcus (in: high G+C Gram-positive bacteria) TaxID=192944 RepID=UPI00096AA032|nr:MULTISPECIES: nuclear transport factor 2 family protein [unclassified Rhodococcus (in: high G+C Gram-positive bacteria)]